MGELFEVRLTELPECWESCGNCSAAEFEVVDIMVAEGDRVLRYDPLLSWEAEKAAFELPAPLAGRVVKLLVEIGDRFCQTEAVMLLEVDS